jgi:GTPase
MKASLKTLKDMASRLGATMRVLRERIATSSASKNLASQHNSNNNNEEKKVAEVLVKKLRKDDREDQDSIVDLRLAVTGAQDAGKSTLLGERIITERIFKVEKNER